MRILWDFTSASNGGALTSLEDFITFLKNNRDLKHEHVVITSIPIRIDKPIENTKLLHIPKRNPLIRLSNFIFGLRRIIKKENIDYVIYPGGLPNPFVGRPFAFFIRQALYFCEVLKQMSLKSRFGFGLRKRILKLVAKRADVIFVQTDFMKEKVESVFKPNGEVIKIVWNVLNDGLIPKERHKKKCVGERIKFLYVSLPNGRPYKNHLNLLRGFQLALDMGLSAEMILTCPRLAESKDETVKVIHKEIEKLGLDENVTLTGKLSREETLALYTEADIFVFPSTCESFGVPLLEAMAFGLPILGSDVPVIREVTYNCGLYFNPKDPNAISSCIFKAINMIDKMTIDSSKVYLQFYRGLDVWEEVLLQITT